ncbi:MAG: tandem-95 repeat protein [Planctomycetes bacterium]|nr:tandem-95 repeat protein [Planctomycetota bacterium]
MKSLLSFDHLQVRFKGRKTGSARRRTRARTDEGRGPVRPFAELLEDRMLLSGGTTLVTDSTLGFYNAAIGLVLDGTQAPFPCANVRCGDPTIRPAPEPNLTAAAGVLGSWLAPNPLPLNSNWSASPQPIPPNWAVNTETAIIYQIDAGPRGMINVKGNFGVDNGIFVWVNGVYKFGALAPGGAPAFEYSNIDLGNLHPGLNFIQILREDHGVVTGYTTLITGDCPVNRPPVAYDDNYSVAEDPGAPGLAVTAPGVLANDPDVDWDTLTAVLDTGPANGTLVLEPDGSFSYMPNGNFFGSDSFTYHAVDSDGASSNGATVTISVGEVNDAPIAVADSAATLEDTAVSGNMLVNDTDPDNTDGVAGNEDALTAVVDSGPAHGTLVLNPVGSFIYTPDCGFIGTDSFTYKANDGLLYSSLATGTITVTPGLPGFSFRDGCLSITGSEGADTIQLKRAGRGFKVVSNFGTFEIPLRESLQRIVVQALGGNDTVNLAALGVGQRAEVDGADGNDRITGGAGHDILLGGSGNDELVGGNGDNLLIGGAGGDRLVGSSGSDLLIADILDDPFGQLDLGSLLDSWRSATGSAAKQAAAQGLIDHVLCDRASDRLIGGRGVDLFVAELTDVIQDRRAEDMRVQV